MAEVERLEKLEDVVAHVVIREHGIKHLEVGVVDVLEDQARGLALGLSHDVQKLDDVGSTSQVLQDLNLALDFLLLDGLEDLNDALFRVVPRVPGFRLCSIHTHTHTHTYSHPSRIN